MLNSFTEAEEARKGKWFMAALGIQFVVGAAILIGSVLKDRREKKEMGK